MIGRLRIFSRTKNNKRKLFIGTSGWVYYDWEGIFYPKNLNSKDKLKYFSSYFKTTEINYSFYHLPRPDTYQNWYKITPADFVFAVKASRFITHIKHLRGIKEAWELFLGNALNLKEKLGPILFQFPPSFKSNTENIKRLEEFLNYITFLRLSKKKYFTELKFAFEFRDKSWCDEKTYNLLKKYNASWVIADSSNYPKAEVVTADFVYIRMHGPKVLFSSKYEKEELQDLAKKIKKWLASASVYVYFNNDIHGYAIENARELIGLCEEF